MRISALGLGCMGMSEFYGATDDTESLRTLARALELGVDFLDTADMYGHGHNEELLGRFLREQGRRRVRIATKFGIQRENAGYGRNLNNSPDYVRSACEASLRRLGTDHIDLYYIHRVDPDTPIEETMQALGGLVESGKIGHVGICEVNADTLRRAHSAFPLTALQTEYSLWTREPERDVLTTCSELGIGVVPYSPLGRGFLTGAFESTDAFTDDDFRRANPRFQTGAFEANLSIVHAVRAIAEDNGCTAAQIALAWLLAGNDHVVPIPGTRRIERLEENLGALEIRLTREEIERLEVAIPPGSATGERYTQEGMKGVDV